MAGIGFKVGLSGESEFQKALKEISKSTKELGSESKLVASQFDKNDKSIQALTARNEILNKQIEEQTKKVDICAKGLENAKKVYGENSAKVQDWQIKLNNATAELNNLQKKLDKNTTALQETTNAEKEGAKGADKLATSTKEAGEESKSAGNKFETFGKVVAGVGATLAAAGAAALASIVALGKGLANLTKEGAEYADNILTQSVITGISTDKLQEYAYAAELVDVSVDTISNTMKKNVMAMKNAANGSAQYADAFNQLGISVTDSNGELRNSETVYWEMIDALGKVENETQRDALAMTLLGKSATDLNPLILAGSERMAELGEEARKAGYVLSTDTLNSYGAYDDALQKLSGSTKAAKNALGTILLPVLSDLATSGTNLLGGFTRAVNESGGDFVKMSEMLSDLIPEAVSVITNNLPKLLAIVSTALQAVLDLVIKALPSILEVVVDLVPKLLSTILEAVPKLLDTLLKAGTAIVETIIAFIPGIISACLIIIQKVVDALPTLIVDLINAIIDILPSIIEAISNALPLLINSVTYLITALADYLPKLIVTVIKMLPTIIGMIITAVKNSLPALIKMVVYLIGAIAEAMPDIMMAIIEMMPELIVMVVNTIIDLLPIMVDGLIEFVGLIVKKMPEILRGLFEKMEGFGKNIIDSLIEGLKNAWPRLLDTFRNIGNNITTAFKNLFGIHSPSTVFAEIGENLSLGLGEGFEGTMKNVAKDMENSIPTNFNITPNINGVTKPTNVIVQTDVEELNLLRQQNQLLQGILEKDVSLSIGDETIGLANSRYVQKRGLNLNQGVYADAY